MTAQYLNNDTETSSEEVDSGIPQPFPPPASWIFLHVCLTMASLNNLWMY